MDETTIRGEWWLPGNKEESTPGILNYTPQDGGELDLFGSLSDVENDPFGVAEEDVIYGNSLRGTDVKLQDCRLRTTKIYSSEGPIQTAYASEIFVGPQAKIAEFDEIRVRFPQLISFFGESSTTTRINKDTQLPVTEVDQVDPITAKLNDITVSLETATRLRNNDPSQTEYIQQAYVTLSNEDMIEFEEGKNYIQWLRDYFALATGRPVYPKWIVGIHKSEEKVSFRGNDFPAPNQSVDIYYKMSNHPESEQDYRFRWPHFSLNDLSFEESLKEWISHAKAVSTFHELYFNVFYNPNMELKYRFLSLCFAIESYFGYHFPDKQNMERGEFNELKEDIFEAIPDDAGAKKRIEDLIDSIGNDYSIRDKLRVIINNHSDILSDIIDADEITKDIRDTRHDFAHGLGGSLNRSKTEPDELATLYYNTRIIVEACLYDILSLPSERIKEIIETRYDLEKLHYST